MNEIDRVEAANMKPKLPPLQPGDTVRVHVRVKEMQLKEEGLRAGKKKTKETERERVQVFEGVVIGLRGSGTRASMTVRKVSFGEGVERIFPLHSKTVDKIEIIRHAHVRRAKLYFLRERKGRASRLRERRQETRS